MNIQDVVKAWANEKLPREYDPLGLALADLVTRLAPSSEAQIAASLKELRSTAKDAARRKPRLKLLLAYLRATDLMLNRLRGAIEHERYLGAPARKDDRASRTPAMVEYRRFVVRRFERST